MSHAAKFEQVRSLIEAGRLDQAKVLCQRLVQALPGDAGTNSLMSGVFLRLGLTTQALHYANRAVEIAPREPALLVELGRLLAIEKKAPAAIDVLRKAVEIDPAFLPARRVLASTLAQENRFKEADEQCRTGLAVHRNDVVLQSVLAGALLNLGRAEDAVELTRACAEQHPGDTVLVSGLALMLNYVPGVTSAESLAAHRRFGALLEAQFPSPLQTYLNNRDPHRRLRVGFISPDLRAHSVAYFMEPLLKNLDAAAVEVYIYQTNRIADAVTQRLKPLAAVWRVMDNISDPGLAERIYGDRVDILIELSGHTHAHSLAAMHLRPAPVQATYLGYPNTTGVEAVGNRIVDSITDPLGAADDGAVEQLARLDPCFLCYQPPADAPSEASLPPAATSGRITFGSFNSLQKLNRAVVDLWSRLLLQHPASRLVLKSFVFADPSAREEVPSRFAARGIDPQRIVCLSPEVAVTDHLALYSMIDIALDPFPYNGTTTTCEALWMGVPVVTLAGESHAQRVGASLLSCIGCPELIARDESEYLGIADRLAHDLTALGDLRQRLRGRMREGPLCNGPAFARRFEALLRAMWHSYLASP